MKQTLNTSLTGLGIGPRIVLIFTLAFSVMGGFGLVLMRTSLLPTFERMESDVALESAWRVVHGFEQQMSPIAELSNDWAVWDEMYLHVQQPDPAFERSNYGSDVMESAKYHSVLLLDRNHQVAGFGSRPLTAGALPQEQDLALPLIERLNQSPMSPGRTECGLMTVANALSTVCWAGVLKSNGQGPVMGTVAIASELDTDTLDVMARSAGAAFTLEPLGVQHTPAPSGLAWKLPSFQHLSNTELVVQVSENSLVMHHLLHDINEKPIAWVSVKLDRELMLQGRKVIRDVLIQLAVVALVTGLVLLVTVQWWLVRPITRLRRSVTLIGETKGWHMQLVVDRPDEIGALAKGINGLLEALRTHVDALTKLSSTDALTGIANRRQFDARLADELARLGRRTGPLSLLLIDVDHFKLYNDRYGHPQGDEVLRQLGVLLRASCRKQDLPARVGGEEFALILPDTDEAGATAMADKIMGALAVLAVEHDHSTTDRMVTVSIGVTTWHAAQDGGADALYAQADKALYAAKQLGRNRVCTFGTPSAPSI